MTELFRFLRKLIEGPWKLFFKGLFGFLEAITTGVFRDKKFSAGRRANILVDLVTACLCVAVFFKCQELLAFSAFICFIVFASWCLISVR